MRERESLSIREGERKEAPHTKQILSRLRTTPFRTHRDVSQDPVLAHAVAVLVFEGAVDGGDGWGVAGFLFFNSSQSVSSLGLAFADQVDFTPPGLGTRE
jgi:hypothetical protein